MTTAIQESRVTRARDLTEQIKAATNGLFALLTEAWESKAWSDLGYETWNAYIDGEFEFSSNYAYRLVQQGQVVRQLQMAVEEVLPIGNAKTITPPSEPIRVTEASARVIAPALPEVVERVREQVTEGVVPQVAVEQAVREQRAKPKAARRGPPSLTDKLRRWRDEIEVLSEQLEGDALEYMVAAHHPDLALLKRTAEAEVEFWSLLLERLASAEAAPPMVVDKWASI